MRMQAYSPYVPIPSVDTPGWPHSAGPAAARTTAPSSSTSSSSSNGNSNSSSSAASSAGVTSTTATFSSTMEMYGMKRIPLPLKEYEQELKNEEAGPELLYDFSSMTAW